MEIYLQNLPSIACTFFKSREFFNININTNRKHRRGFVVSHKKKVLTLITGMRNEASHHRDRIESLKDQ